MVLLVLALIWGALLVSWLRSRSSGTFSDSVGSFRQNLSVLERATPTTVRPANRLRDGHGVRPATPARPLGPGVARRTPPTGPARPAGPARGARPLAGRPSYSATTQRRRQAQKRRRDVFVALVAGAAGSLLLALVPGLSIMWSVQLLFDAVLAVYVALLVRIRNQAAERELKLRFMPSQPRPSRARPAYDFGGAGYGDLELRRAAN